MNDFIINNISGALYVIVLHSPHCQKNKYPYLTFYFNLYAMKLYSII
jgi:hypothetical protein